ncbi:MAG: hypothetical protein ACREHF_12880 [Rhizomicrobium sp.]
MVRKLLLSSAVLLVATSSALAGIQLRAVAIRAAHAGVFSHRPVAPNLYRMNAEFVYLPPQDGQGNDEWPCFGGQNQADCSNVALGGVVLGTPQYVWPLANCDANMNGAPNCGQINWFYEDDTNDTTDHLFLTVKVKQHSKYVLDVGPIDYGVNPFAGMQVVIYDDTAFGTLGQSGPGNGFCAGTTETCVNPHSGPAVAEITTTVGTYTTTQKFRIYFQ